MTHHIDIHGWPGHYVYTCRYKAQTAYEQIILIFGSFQPEPQGAAVSWSVQPSGEIHFGLQILLWISLFCILFEVLLVLLLTKPHPLRSISVL